MKSSKSSKLGTREAMSSLITQVRNTVPFDLPAEILCAKTCDYGCPKKLMEYLDSELVSWEFRLAEGENPNFGEIHQLGKTAQKIHRVLQKNGLLTA